MLHGDLWKVGSGFKGSEVNCKRLYLKQWGSQEKSLFLVKQNKGIPSIKHC